MLGDYNKEHPFLQKPVLRLLILCLLFVAAFGLRLYLIDQPPVDFAATRQYHSAILARGYYFEALESAPQWKRDIASLNEQRETIVEPPLMELAASYAYHALGGEYLWFPRLMSLVFWLVGGIFLYLLARRIGPPAAAVLSTAFYLFLPYGVLASRSFQPDPLMLTLLLASVFTIVRYHERPSAPRLAVAGLLSALALFVKPGICLFQIFGAFVALGVHKRGVRGTLGSAHFLVFSILSLLPTGLYYWYGTFVGGFLEGQVEQKVMPQLLLYPSFWALWLKQIVDVIGGTYLVGALLGVLMLREGLPRSLMVGLWGGYFVFGLVFTYHIHTHEYYQLQLIPVVALSLAPVAAMLVGYLGRVGTRWHLRAAIGGILLLAVLSTLLAAITSIVQAQVRDPNAADPDVRVETYQDVGEAVDHGHSNILSAPDYGLPLEYHGWLSGTAWPNEWDVRAEQLQGAPQIGLEERLDTLEAGYAPEYFVIVRDFWHFEEQKDLRDFLAEEYPLVAEGDDYWVFDLRARD